MFSTLSERLTSVLRGLSGRGVLTEDAVKEGLREIRRVLLEADVSFELTREFVRRVQEKAVGQEITKSVSPGNQLVKIVHDELVHLLGSESKPLTHGSVPPSVILMVGLQGSGKTTTSAKLAARLKKEHKAPLLVAADVSRPAAETQLRQLGQRIDVEVFGAENRPDLSNNVVSLVREAVSHARSARARTLIVDTAGRLQIDQALMDELVAVKDAVQAHETLLVADGMTGQDAVKIAAGFHKSVGITGVVLTKLDGDARGGAALSIHGVTGAPIKFIGVGEQLEALQVFDPQRMAGRILQKGDIVGLVEKATESVRQEDAEQLAKKALSSKGMDLEDFLVAMKQIQKLGPLKGVLGMLPGVNAKMLKKAQVDDNRLRHLEAIVLSMTPQERRRPDVLNGSRRARISRGCGRPVSEVNSLLKQFTQMKKMMKSFGQLGMRAVR
jgi:signal recognition particle subunit SRP54